MSYNGSGTFVINSAGQPVVSGTVISSTAFNALTADLATGLSTAITKDGQTTITANIPMANYKFTGLGTGSAAGDSANLSQVQSTAVKLLASVSGADTITAVGSPNVAAYVAGQMFYFVAAGANTGAVTINIDSLGAKSITRDGTTALAAGDIQSGEVCVIVYDGTQFQLVNGASQSAAIVTNSLTVNGTSSLDGAVTINDSGADVDFRIESDTNANAFFLDGANGNVGIGTSSLGMNAAGLPLVVGSGSGNNGMTIFSGSSASGSIHFADAATTGADSYRGIIAYSHTNNAMTLWTDATERMRIDSSGNLGLGTTSPIDKLEVNNAAATCFIRVRSGDTDSAGLIFGNQSDSATSGILFDHSTNNLTFRGYNNDDRMTITSAGELLVGGTTSINAFGGAVTVQRLNANPVLNLFRDDTSISSGNAIGVVNFYGNDTTGNTPTLLANIRAEASGTHAAGDNPTDLVFGTTPDGTETVAEAGRITQAGSYVLKGGTTTAAAGVGIIFPATQVASADANSLDDYEEGTWTPAFHDDASLGLTYSQQVGTYTKIGRIVHAKFRITVSAKTGTSAQGFFIKSLPFSIGYVGTTVSTAMSVINAVGNLTDVTNPEDMSYTSFSANAGLAYFSSSGGNLTASDINSNTFIEGILIYQV